MRDNITLKVRQIILLIALPISPDTFRKLARYIKDKNIIHHTYQPKEESHIE
jgi:hypothetical protein